MSNDKIGIMFRLECKKNDFSFIIRKLIRVRATTRRVCHF